VLIARLTTVLAGWPRRLIALGCLALAAFSALDHEAAPAPRSPTGEPVVVAARPLAVGSLLTAGDLHTIEWPASIRPADALQRPVSAIGRRLSGALGAGDPVTSQRLVGADLTTGLPPGLAAVPVPLGDTGSAGLIHPGDVVDLFVADTSGGRAAVLARALLVLAVVVPADGYDGSAELVVAADDRVALDLAGTGRTVLAAVRNPP
jgi:pilus assembly protein CpaB